MKTILCNGPIFTGTSDTTIDGYAILINDDQIEKVDAKEVLLKQNPGVPVIDVEGRTILPGMVDAHRHVISLSDFDVTTGLITTGAIEGVVAAKEALSMGITTIRDPGCKHTRIFQMKEAIDRDFIPGPTIYPAGPNPTGSAGPFTWRNYIVKGPWEMRDAVRTLKREGAMWIKLVVSVDSRESGWKRTDMFLTSEELRAAVDEAKRYGYRVSGHIEGLEAARACVEAGFSALEHATSIDEKLAALMAEKGVFLVPTLSAYSMGLDQWETSLQPEEKDDFDRWIDEHNNSFTRALKAGVKMAVGTDPYRFPPLDCYVKEIEMMVDHGISIPDVLKAATANGAALLGEEEKFGTLEAGKRADIIAVDGNPLKDIKCLLNVDLVIKKGKEYFSRGITHR